VKLFKFPEPCNDWIRSEVRWGISPRGLKGKPAPWEQVTLTPSLHGLKYGSLGRDPQRLVYCIEPLLVWNFSFKSSGACQHMNENCWEHEGWIPMDQRREVLLWGKLLGLRPFTSCEYGEPQEVLNENWEYFNGSLLYETFCASGGGKHLNWRCWEYEA
jgi:hypothetical protein